MADEKNTQTVAPTTPGQVIVPGGVPAPASVQPQTAPQPPIAASPTPIPTPPAPQSAPEPIAPPQTAEELLGPLPQPDSSQAHSDEAGISWTASEFIAHEKSAEWYIALAAATVVASLVIFLLTKDAVSTGIIPIVAIIFGILAARQPRQLAYRVDDTGIQIGQKHYPYEDYKSFAVQPEGAFSSISLLPMKRFAPLITIYYAPETEDEIITILSDFLPGEVRDHDLIDRFMHRIRF